MRKLFVAAYLSAFVSLCFPNVPQADNPAGLRMIVLKTEAEAERIRAAGKFEGDYLGIVSVTQLRPEFQTAVEGLKPGEVSAIAKFSGGFALFQFLTREETVATELKRWADAGKDPRSPMIESLWTMAIASSDAGMIKTLLNSGADANMTFGDGSTVLMGAAQAGEIEIVRALLAAGASAKAATNDGTTAVLVAAQAGRENIIRVLLAAGADANARNKNGVTPLIDASFGGHLETVRVLLESKADPNVTLGDGSNALMAASVKGHNDIVRALLAAGARANPAVKGGGTALMEAAYAGQTETIKILLAAGADPKVADTNGLTALMGAAFKGSADSVRALLDAGAPANAKDAKGWTPLTYARASANPETVRIVLSRTTDITAEEKSIALGGTYINEYYSSNEAKLLDQAATEFQKVLKTQPQNVAALEWMGAVEFLRWNKPPTVDDFKKANALLQRSVDLDAKDPDRNCWIAAIASIFVSSGQSLPQTDLDDAIQHGRKAIELDPQFADAMDHLSVLYRKKGDAAAADASRQEAARIRQRLGNRPSRFNDQFTRPALPAPGT